MVGTGQNYLKLEKQLLLALPHFNKPEAQMQELDLTPELVSLAFLVLTNQAEPPQELLQLPKETWQELRYLLVMLEQEKLHSSLH
jgi:hypothetical protein